jgi:putative redox protein
VAAQVSTGDHEFLVDEPPPLGANRGPDPYELLLSALGACTAITTMLYARRKGWPLEAVVVHLTHAREHTDDCASGGYCDSAEVHVELEGQLDDEQRHRLLDISTRCPVARTLARGIEVVHV